MSEELLTDSESFDGGEVVVVPGRELVVARTLRVGILLVPAFFQASANALGPFFYFGCLCPCTPGIGRARDTVLAQCEFWWQTGIYWLHDKE